jgi:hypothetical protein
VEQLKTRVRKPVQMVWNKRSLRASCANVHHSARDLRAWLAEMQAEEPLASFALSLSRPRSRLR